MNPEDNIAILRITYRLIGQNTVPIHRITCKLIGRHMDRRITYVPREQHTFPEDNIQAKRITCEPRGQMITYRLRGLHTDPEDNISFEWITFGPRG
jgi:hypothetical protein